MKTTLKYFLKTRWNVIAIISCILLLITFVYLTNMDFVYTYEYYDDYGEIYNVVKAQGSPFPMLAAFASVLSTLVVIFEFYFKMRKINIDQMHALPIKREKLYLSKLIICALEVIIPLTLSFILSIVIISLSKNIFDLIYFIPFYFGLVFLSLILIISFAFIYTRANTFFDGIINMLFYIFVLVILFLHIIDVFELGYQKFGSGGAFFIYSPIAIFTQYMNKLFMNKEFEFNISQSLSLVIFILFGIVSLYLFIRLNKKEPSENCTQLSSSYFSYKVFIPIYSIILTSITIFSGTVISLGFTIVFTYLAYVIYRRSFKLSKRDYLMIGIVIIAGILLGIFFDYINQFFIKP